MSIDTLVSILVIKHTNVTKYVILIYFITNIMTDMTISICSYQYGKNINILLTIQGDYVTPYGAFSFSVYLTFNIIKCVDLLVIFSNYKFLCYFFINVQSYWIFQFLISVYSICINYKWKWYEILHYLLNNRIKDICNLHRDVPYYSKLVPIGNLNIR